jgi:hypothetical protein
MRVGQQELADVTIEREPVRTAANGEHKHRRWTVKCVAGGNLAAAGLKKIVRSRRGPLQFSGQRRTEKMLPTDRLTSMFDEPSSGSKTSRYLPRGLLGGNRIDVVHFFRRHRRQMATPFTMVNERLVGQHVEFFLGFALHVLAPSSPSTPASEPRETPCAMALHERTTSLMSIEKSPTSAGFRRCSSIRNLLTLVRPHSMAILQEMKSCRSRDCQDSSGLIQKR